MSYIYTLINITVILKDATECRDIMLKLAKSSNSVEGLLKNFPIYIKKLKKAARDYDVRDDISVFTSPIKINSLKMGEQVLKLVEKITAEEGTGFYPIRYVEADELIFHKVNSSLITLVHQNFSYNYITEQYGRKCSIIFLGILDPDLKGKFAYMLKSSLKLNKKWQMGVEFDIAPHLDLYKTVCSLEE